MSDKMLNRMPDGKLECQIDCQSLCQIECQWVRDHWKKIIDCQRAMYMSSQLKNCRCIANKDIYIYIHVYIYTHVYIYVNMYVFMRFG